MAVPDPPCVDATASRLLDLLKRAREIKKSNGIDPALPASEFAGDLGLAHNHSHSVSVEISARRLFQGHVAASDIHSAEFVDIWNLLDILLICGDQEQCEPTLLWYLIEELLDSQSIDGCRVVFDYLESRRERLIAKSFGKVSLVILRACNELLRRLSRAEDAVFCGRVFIFLFQSFPLGDRSSVNRQGDYNNENVTIFDEQTTALPTSTPDADSKVDDVSAPADEKSNAATDPTEPEGNPKPNSMTADELYPTFWSLQKSFAYPPRVCEQSVLDEFKKGFESTLAKFKDVPKVIQGTSSDSPRGTKRKSDEMEHDEFASSFNPKYLTSRELFQLELSDLAFQRHILVQALILLDFLLSLSEKAKRRLAKGKVNFTLSEQDTEWATKMKNDIYAALRDGPDGKAFARVVETVLSRDKNWVRWKEENCPEILRQPVAPDVFMQATDGARAACAWKRIRATPLGSLDLTFLSDSDHGNGVVKLQDSARFLVPDAETLVKAIQNDDLDLEMATTDEEKHALQIAKTSKTWRTLRIAGKTKLTLFDKVDDGKNLEALFQTNGAEHGLKSEDMPDTDGGGGESLGPVSADKTGNDGSMEVRTDQVVSHAAVAEAS